MRTVRAVNGRRGLPQVVYPLGQTLAIEQSQIDVFSWIAVGPSRRQFEGYRLEPPVGAIRPFPAVRYFVGFRASVMAAWTAFTGVSPCQIRSCICAVTNASFGLISRAVSR
jgi:hypothetical protein